MSQVEQRADWLSRIDAALASFKRDGSKMDGGSDSKGSQQSQSQGASRSSEQ